MLTSLRTAAVALMLGLAGPALADDHAGKYMLDASHSQVLFS
jgi:polyisoprenoid-binding protein YceI